MRETKQTRPNGAPTPVRFSETTLKEIEEVAELLGMSRQDVIRLSTSAGLKILRELGYGGLVRLIAGEAAGKNDGAAISVE